jgi:glycosyltransferase
MITLFIFKSNTRGMQYGMGTYIRELTSAVLKYSDVSIYLISYYDSESREFSIETVSERYHRVTIPGPKSVHYLSNKSEGKYASIVVDFLSEIIPATGEVVFQMNYLDDLPIIEKIKEKYPYPVIGMVHFAQWQQLFNGNRDKLKGLNIDNPSDNIEFTLSREKKMYKISDHIVSVTRYMKDFLIKEYSIDPDKLDVIPNGLDLSGKTSSPEERLKLKHNLGFREEDKIVLFSGRIDECKGIFFLIDAFCEACKKSDNLRLVIAGQGDIQASLKRCNSFYGRITFTGFIPSDQLIGFYQIADVGVFPSVYDHCPYSVLEMIAYRIPLILSGINGLNEILDDNQCLFIDPKVSDTGEISYDVQELTGLILSLTNDKEVGKRLTAEYKDLMEKRFSSERMAKEFYSLLKKSCMIPVEV